MTNSAIHTPSDCRDTNSSPIQASRFLMCITLRLLIFVPVLFLSTLANSQDLAGLEQGIKPYGLYEGGDIDSISTVNGSLTLHIPLISYPQRGGKLHMGFHLVYAHTVLQPQAACNPVTHSCDNGSYYVVHRMGTSPNNIAPLYLAPDFVPTIIPAPVGSLSPNSILEYDGAVHTLNEVGGTPGANYVSVDATGYLSLYSNGPGTIVDRHGTRYATGSIEDVNGNLITVNSSQGITTSWTDTMGRVIPAGTTSTSDFSGCPSSTSSAALWSPPGPEGGTSTFKFCYAGFSFSFTPPDCIDNGQHSDCTGGGGSGTYLLGLVLPNNTAWTFNYDTFGNLSSITLPTGGTISYTWNYSSTICNLPEYTQNGVNTGLFPYTMGITSRSVNANDGTGAHVWNYSITIGGPTVVTDPARNDSVHTETFLASSCSAYETELDEYSGSYTSGTLLRKVATTYNYSQESSGELVFNVVPLTVTTTDLASGQVSQVTKTYDSGVGIGNGFNAIHGDVLTQTDYDYGNGSPGNMLRTTTNTYMALSGPNSSSYLASNLLDIPYTVQVSDSSGQLSLSQYNYDETARASSGLTSSYQFSSSPPSGSYRGNNTSVLQLLNTGTFTCPNGNSGGSNGYLVSKKTYFDDGMLDTSADPCSNTTTYAYSLTYWGALSSSVTNALGQQTGYAYDFNTSLKTSTTDPNQLLTSYTYDSLWRLQSTTHPDSSVDVDTTSYEESVFPFTATITSPMNVNQNTTPLAVFDGLGRVSQTQSTSDPQGTIYADTTYDALGRLASTSNPYRKGTDATSSPGTTSYTYDALSRKIQETMPDGSAITTVYCGPWTLVTDPTKRWRRSRVDALGRLVEVDEPNSSTASVNSNGCPGMNDPIWVTSYTYDGLARLKQVVQNGTHTRTFSYDSLSRLLTSNNPETGTITYSCNPDGTVLTKQDARGITTCYGTWSSTTSTCNGGNGYDALHRPLTISYSNGDPTLTFTYDGSGCLGLSACQNIGHRTGMTDGSGSENWAYQVDKTNNRNVHVEQRTIIGVTKTTTYYLDFQGNVTQIVYPTGRTINYTYDSANRPSSVSDSSNGITYVADWKTPPANTTCTAGAVCYTPQGTVYGMSIGQSSSFTGLNLLATFNSRLEPNQIKATSTAGTTLDITYSFVDPTTGYNAGHVNTITNSINSARSQTFTYDQLNRIVTAYTSSTSGSFCWGYSYTYDAWGNLNAQAGLSGYGACTEGTSSAMADGNNHLTGFTYFSAGNTQNDGNYAYTWDAQGQMKTAGGVTYTYDGDGRRAAKVGSKLYWYGSGGEVLAETDASGNTQNEYVFFGSKRVAVLPESGSPMYYVEDFLGTSKSLVTSTGSKCYDADLTPFGGEKLFNNTCPQNYKFEGKERDTETGNDDFGAREYTWRFGRWLSADWSATPEPVPYADLSNPQTLNLYAMVGDDPESFADLDGHCCDDELEFGFGVVRGIASSVTFGVVGAPKSTDSAISTVGQLVGTGLVGIGGETTKDAGGGLAVGSLVTELPSGGTSTVGVIAGGSGLLIGAAMEGGAAANVARIVSAPLQSTAGDSQTGSYTNTHESGKTYSGKGSRERSQTSAKRVEKATGDKHVATDWKPSSNEREAFKDESRRLDANGGPQSNTNYNQVESPGKKFREQDAGAPTAPTPSPETPQ